MWCVECHLLFSLVSPIVSCSMITRLILEQLECLRSVIPPPYPTHPHPCRFTSGPKKRDNVKVKNCQKLPKILILKFCKQLDMGHTWCCLIRCIIWNGSNQSSRRYIADTGCGTDGRMDRRMDRRSETNIPPNNFVVGGGITRMLVTIGIHFKQHFDTRYFAFCNLSPPRMFLSLDLLSEYWIQHGTIRPL